jgi:hypothetical protein
MIEYVPRETRQTPRGNRGVNLFMDHAKKAIDKVRELDARRVFLYKVQRGDLDAYLAMPDGDVTARRRP